MCTMNEAVVTVIMGERSMLVVDEKIAFNKHHKTIKYNSQSLVCEILNAWSLPIN